MTATPTDSGTQPTPHYCTALTRIDGTLEGCPGWPECLFPGTHEPIEPAARIIVPIDDDPEPDDDDEDEIPALAVTLAGLLGIAVGLALALAVIVLLLPVLL